jgi:hypothetical protein
MNTINIERKLKSSKLTKEDLQKLIGNLNKEMGVKCQDYNLEITSKIKLESGSYNLEGNNLKEFFNNVLPNKLTNLRVTWSCYKKDSKNIVVINLSENGSAVSIKGESKKWVDSICMIINDIINKRKNFNNLKFYLYGLLSFFIAAVVIYFLIILFFPLTRDPVSLSALISSNLILFFWIITGRKLIPHTIILLEIEKESKWGKYLVDFIIGLLTLIVGALFAKFKFF